MKNNKFLKCIVDDNRRNIILFLEKKEKCVCEIEEKLNLEQSLVSHHLHLLKKCGIVQTKNKGKNVYYKITEPSIYDFVKKAEILSDKLQQKEECC